MTDDDPVMTRRAIGRRTVIAGSTVLAPGLVGVAAGETGSGFVELTATATVPQGTRLFVTINADTTGDGTTDQSQTAPIFDGTETYVFDQIPGAEDAGNSYSLTVELETDDETVTPELESAELTLPSDPPPQGSRATEPQGIRGLLDNPLVMLIGMVMGTTAIGIGSRSMAIGAWAGMLMFIHLGLQSGYYLFEQLAFASLGLIFLGIGFKLWRLEGAGGGAS